MAKKLKKGATTLFKDLEKLLNEIFGYGEEEGDHDLTKGEKNWKERQKRIQETIDRKKNPKRKKKYEANNQKRRIVESNGLRGSKALSNFKKKEIFDYSKKYFKEDEIADDIVHFSSETSTLETGYTADWDLLTINSDIMLGKLSTANSRLSWKAAIAHELEGHRLASLNNKTFFDVELSL